MYYFQKPWLDQPDLCLYKNDFFTSGNKQQRIWAHSKLEENSQSQWWHSRQLSTLKEPLRLLHSKWSCRRLHQEKRQYRLPFCFPKRARVCHPARNDYSSPEKWDPISNKFVDARKEWLVGSILDIQSNASRIITQSWSNPRTEKFLGKHSIDRLSAVILQVIKISWVAVEGGQNRTI